MHIPLQPFCACAASCAVLIPPWLCRLSCCVDTSCGCGTSRVVHDASMAVPPLVQCHCPSGRAALHYAYSWELCVPMQGHVTCVSKGLPAHAAFGRLWHLMVCICLMVCRPHHTHCPLQHTYSTPTAHLQHSNSTPTARLQHTCSTDTAQLQHTFCARSAHQQYAYSMPTTTYSMITAQLQHNNSTPAAYLQHTYSATIAQLPHNYSTAAAQLQTTIAQLQRNYSATIA